MKSNKTPLTLLGIAVLGLALTGCKDPTEDLAKTTPRGGKENPQYNPTALAGISKDITKSQDPKRLGTLIASTSRFGSRSNPFAMSADEIAFDKAQAAERIVIEGGQFGQLWEPFPDTLPEANRQPSEPQPYRRLSGILIGDSILAILEEGNRSTIIRPGMMIPDTEWRVVSIDRDKAILRREGNRLPKEVEVRLEIGFPGSGGGGNPAGGGGFPPPGGGRPGGNDGGAATPGKGD